MGTISLALWAVLAMSPPAPEWAPLLGGVFDAGQLRRMHAGEAVVRVYHAEDRTEVLTMGAVRVRADVGDLMRCARDPRCLRGHQDLRAVGRLEGAPTSSQFEALSLDPRQVELLARCRVGGCKLRLPSWAIERFGREVDWRRDDAGAAANRVMREVLAAVTAEYHRQGDRGLVVYADRPVLMSAVDATALLAARSFPIPGLDPLRRALSDPPAGVGGADEYVYWFQERAFRKVLMGVHHVAVGSWTDGDRLAGAAVSKQVYASNFMNGSLEAVVLWQRAGEPGGLLVYASRSQSDIRRTGFNALERLILRKWVGSRLEDQMLQLKARLES
jgi:hypothetical protein